MMDAMKVAAVLRRAAENAGCSLHEVVSGGGECPEGSCNGCREVSAAWANEAADAIERCALPEGVKWPRFEDGEPVRLDSMLLDRVTGKPYEAGIVVFNKSDDDTISVHVGGGVYEMGERVKRPPVLAADGEPLEVGQTVYVIANGKTHHVTEVDAVSKRFRSMEQVDGSHWLDPMCFTHQRPVLDADGVPIKVGDSVWYAYEGASKDELTVSGFIEGGRVVVNDAKGLRGYPFPHDLTHAKPEPPDTWERIEDDVMVDATDYCEAHGIKTEYPKHCGKAKCGDLVRRCRALAERGGR